MDFEQAKKALLDGYIVAGMTLVEEQDRQVILQYHNSAFSVCEEDIQSYADSEALRISAQIKPVECGLVSTTYREQIVQPLDPTRWRHLPPLEMGFVFGAPDDDNMYVTIGAPSDDFVNFFRFDPIYLQICLERMRRAPDSDKPLDIRQGFYRLPTVKVHNIDERTIDNAWNTAQQVIDYCLFELSYLKGLPVGLAEEWPASRRMNADVFQFEEASEENLLPMPPADFDGDVVAFYQLGMSTRLPLMQYWAFYQVLEHFFVRIYDESLHKSLSDRLKDPRFKPSAAQLDRIVQDVIDHLDAVDEIAMLVSVLEKYVDPEKAIAFITQYETHLGEARYTKRRRLFGEDIEVKLDADTVLDNIARTIHAIRLNLLYSSDRFSRTARSVSYEKVSEIVKPEVPLLKFLAERVIIGSAS